MNVKLDYSKHGPILKGVLLNEGGLSEEKATEVAELMRLAINGMAIEHEVFDNQFLEHKTYIERAIKKLNDAIAGCELLGINLTIGEGDRASYTHDWRDPNATKLARFKLAKFWKEF